MDQVNLSKAAVEARKNMDLTPEQAAIERWVRWALINDGFTEDLAAVMVYALKNDSGWASWVMEIIDDH